MRPHAARLVPVAALCTVVGVVGSAPAAGSAGGRLVGLTQITYGCPGPQREGEQCERWSAFPGAHFALTRDRADRTLIQGTRRILVSDAKGAFRLSLVAGLYTITPLAQEHTRGGSPHTFRMRAGRTVRITIRFLGFPMME